MGLVGPALPQVESTTRCAQEINQKPMENCNKKWFNRKGKTSQRHLTGGAAAVVLLLLSAEVEGGEAKQQHELSVGESPYRRRPGRGGGPATP